MEDLSAVPCRRFASLAGPRHAFIAGISDELALVMKDKLFEGALCLRLNLWKGNRGSAQSGEFRREGVSGDPAEI